MVLGASPVAIKISFISSKDDNDEERKMHSKSGNIEIMMNGEADEFIWKKFLNHLKEDIKISWSNQWKVVSLSSITFIYWILDVIK